MRQQTRKSRRAVGGLFIVSICLAAVAAVPAQESMPGESPAMEDQRVEQTRLASMTRDEIRAAGLRIFCTPFNRLDGFGDGLPDPGNPGQPGGRPTLQGNGALLRVNGLDAQSCLECHSLVSAAEMPPLMGIGGAGGATANAIIMPTRIDPVTPGEIAEFDGRFANPPFVFGSGGVELLGLEMTRDLQGLAQQARDQPGTVVELVARGVEFGSVIADISGELDTSSVEGVDPDLVVRPFGRKGEFATTREFARGAMAFHFGMQPVESTGEGVDGDQDGVIDELFVGELSVLSAFMATLDRPTETRPGRAAMRGRERFQEVGCAACHIPSLTTRDSSLPLRYPEVAADPEANVYMRLDLTQRPAAFEPDPQGGLIVPLFADLKRHDMGPGLAESFHNADEETNRRFTTGRLWGVADSAPYLHDGRASTLTEAILLHGGEAQASRDAFAALDGASRSHLLAFLRTLRTPRDPARDLVDRIHAVEPEAAGTPSSNLNRRQR